MAIPLALIVNELVTNAVKHVGPPCAIMLRAERGTVKLTITDKGQGPPKLQSRRGLGTRIIEAFSTQLGATVETRQEPAGYQIEFTLPVPGLR
jgi:two-component sensor histidine kinase